jgi:hypothetical protein
MSRFLNNGRMKILILIAIVAGVIVGRKFGIFTLLLVSAIFAAAGIAGLGSWTLLDTIWALAPMLIFQITAILRLMSHILFLNHRLISWLSKDKSEKKPHKRLVIK